MLRPARYDFGEAQGPGPSISIYNVGTRVMVDYDAPNLYCGERSLGDWPIGITCNNGAGTDQDYLMLFDSNGALRFTFIYFESGTWDTGVEIACGSTATYGAQIAYIANDLMTINSKSTGLVPLPTTPLPSTFCPDREKCGGAASAGLPINVGSGDATVAQALFTLSQEPSSLPFTLTYHSSAPMFPTLISSPVGIGWTHEYAQTLRPENGTNNRFYHSTAEGYEHEYLRSAPDSFWHAISPADLRGTIIQSGSVYQLTDLNGTITSFDVTTGHWNSTVDRWGNSISGSYTGTNLTRITDSEGRQIQLVYTSGQVTITLPGGNIWKLTLGTNNTLTQVFDSLHTSTTAWRTYSYQNDHAGSLHLLTSIKDDAGKDLEDHTYDATTDRALTSSQAGATKSNVSITYDDVGNTRTVKHTIDATTTETTTFNLIYKGARWLATQITGDCTTCGGSSADLQIFTYDYSDHVIDQKEGSGADQIDIQYTYDVNGMILSKTDAITTASYTYAQGTPAGFLSPWPAFLTSVTENSVGKPGTGNFKTTAYAWATTGSCSGQGNERCLQASVTGYQKPADSSTTTYTTTTKFDAKHRRIEVDGPATNQKSTFAYFTDAATNNGGRLSSTSTYTSATAHLDTTFDLYDVYGTATKSVDPNSVETDKTTDARGRTLTVVSKKPPSDPNEPPDYTTTYSYDSRDRLTDVTLPVANKTHYDYEVGTNRLLDTVRVDTSGNQHERLLLTLNTIGDKIQEDAQSCSTPANPCLSANWHTQRTENFKYDTNNRLTEVDHPTPSGSKVVYTYDSRANLKTVQDENHSTANTTNAYDARNRLTSVTQTLTGATVVAGSCPASAGTIVTCYGHDLQDNLASVIDPNTNQTTYAYDDFRRLQTQSSPVSGATSYTYDPAGNALTVKDANSATTTRVYDAANRVTSATSTRTGFTTETVTYVYDDATSTNYGKGRLKSMTDPVGSATYAYERRGLLRTDSKTISSTTFPLTYAYDPNGNRKTVTYPSARSVAYTFDFADRPLSAARGITTYVSSATYEPFGPETTIVYGNGDTDLPPKNWSSANDTSRPILGEEERCAGVDFRRSRS